MSGSWPDLKTLRCQWQEAALPTALTGLSGDPENKQTQLTTTLQNASCLSSPALYPLTPITTLLKTSSVRVLFSLSFPQFLRILVSAPGTEQTTISCYRCNDLADGFGRPSCSQRVRVQALMSAGLYWCALEQDAESLPAPEGIWPLYRDVRGKREFPLQQSIKYHIMFSSDVVSVLHRQLKDTKLHV